MAQDDASKEVNYMAFLNCQGFHQGGHSGYHQRGNFSQNQGQGWRSNPGITLTKIKEVHLIGHLTNGLIYMRELPSWKTP